MIYSAVQQIIQVLFEFPNTDGTAGQVLQTDGYANLSFGTVGGGGKVLQVVTFTYDVSTATTSTSYITSGLEVSITPSSASSKVLVFVNGVGNNGGVDTHSDFTLFRDAINLSTDTAMSALYNASSVVRGQVAINYLDSPNTTSSTTYSLRLKSAAGTETTTMHQNPSMSVITAMEIGV